MHDDLLARALVRGRDRRSDRQQYIWIFPCPGCCVCIGCFGVNTGLAIIGGVDYAALQTPVQNVAFGLEAATGQAARISAGSHR